MEPTGETSKKIKGNSPVTKPTENLDEKCKRFSTYYCLILLLAGIGFDLFEIAKIYQDIYMLIISCIGFTWLLFFCIDMFRVNCKVQKLGLSNDVEWTYYTYLKARHSYTFYLNMGLAVFCLGNIALTTIDIIKNFLYLNNDSACGDQMKLASTSTDFILSFIQLFTLLRHSTIIINRAKCLAHFGIMTLIALALIKWSIAILEDARHEFHLNSIDTIAAISNMTEIPCQGADLVPIYLTPTIPYLYPFRIEFNLLLAIQWYIVWSYVGQFKTRTGSKILLMTEERERPSELPAQLSDPIMCHQSCRGLSMGLVCFVISFISLMFYFIGQSSDTYAELSTRIVTWEDFIYLTGSILILLILAIQFASLDTTDESCIGSADMFLLVFPIPFYIARGYVSIFNTYGAEFWLDRALPVIALIQPIVQTLCIYYGRKKRCRSSSHVQSKPGRQIITFLLILNIVLWISGTFRAKIKYHYRSLNDFIVVNICRPFVVFYRYHSSVCFASIWKMVYE